MSGHDPGCMCWFCREGDPDGPNPPAKPPEMPPPVEVDDDER